MTEPDLTMIGNRARRRRVRPRRRHAVADSDLFEECLEQEFAEQDRRKLRGLDRYYGVGDAC